MRLLLGDRLAERDALLGVGQGELVHAAREAERQAPALCGAQHREQPRAVDARARRRGVASPDTSTRSGSH